MLPLPSTGHGAHPSRRPASPSPALDARGGPDSLDGPGLGSYRDDADDLLPDSLTDDGDVDYEPSGPLQPRPLCTPSPWPATAPGSLRMMTP